MSATPFQGPDFVVIGAMKCATSTVSAYLEAHPDIFMVANCEPNFFSRDENWARGPAWYATLFEGRSGERICGEGSNHYAYGAAFPDAPQRLASLYPRCRLIYMVRDPVARIASAWVQVRANSPAEAGATLGDGLRRMQDFYIDQSLYWKNLSAWRVHFPDEQIFVGFMEDLERNEADFFRALTAFLGVAYREPPSESTHLNRTVGKTVASPLYDRLRHTWPISHLKGHMPLLARRLVKRHLLSQRVEAKPVLDAATAARLHEAVGQDARQFLAHAGRPADFWPL